MREPRLSPITIISAAILVTACEFTKGAKREQLSSNRNQFAHHYAIASMEELVIIESDTNYSLLSREVCTSESPKERDV